MSLNLKGIKTIANKLKHTKRDKPKASSFTEMETSLKPFEILPREKGTSFKDTGLDTAFESGIPKLKRKQRRDGSDVTITSRLDSFDLTTPMSVSESTISTPSFSKESDSVKVYVRIRPPSSKETKEGNAISVQKTSDSTLQLKTLEGFKNFTFDSVIGDGVDQSILFQTYAAPVVERCLSGYNGCIFAYGQTGSGKTHTMLGDVDMDNHQLNPSAGIIPRVFQYLFELLKERQAATSGTIEYECKCSFLEIYNETITDLLDPKKTHLQIREDKNGTHAAGLTEQTVLSVEEAVALIHVGAANRKVAHTQMNAMSSRSHSLLSCTVTIRRRNDSGIVSVLRSRLNLVDLAGSERQSMTGASGVRLKEASSINKSLSTLGLVILSLGDTKGKKAKHVPYRDSKLTFLLQDSLGGNANAVMFANISPSTRNINETLSTLRFARGAKRVKNKVVANYDCVGDLSSLKAEIAQLKQEVKALKERNLYVEQKAEQESKEESMAENLNFEGDFQIVEAPRFVGLDKTLASALRREDTAHRTVLALTEEILLLQSAVELKESEVRKYKLIGKFKDDKIRRLESMIRKQNQEALGDDAEIQRLKKEVEFFKERASRTPDAMIYAIENMKLKQELSKLKWSVECNNSKERFDQQITELREKLLEVNEEIKKYREFEKEILQKKAEASAMQIAMHPTQSFRLLLLGSKSGGETDELVSRTIAHLAKWAKTVVGVITKPLSKLRIRLKEKQKT